MTIYTDYANKRYTDYITADDLESLFKEYHEDDTVTLFGLECIAIDLLQQADPIAYREMFLDWIDARGYEEVKDADGKMVGYANIAMHEDSFPEDYGN